MKRIACAFVLCAVTLILTGCPKPEVAARDAIAFAKGFIQDQQNQNHDACVAAPDLPVCREINQAIAAQGLAIDALKEYCADETFVSGGGPCHPTADAAPKLKLAMSSLDKTVANIKTLTNQQHPAAK